VNTLSTRPSLLIVDDDALIREGLAIAFDTDFSVYQANSRAAAIALLRGLSSPPQLALIDLGLPPLPHRPDEGFQLIAELLAHSAAIKIFTLSGQDEKTNARHARALGAIDFIAKPCSPEKIKQYLHDALALQHNEHNTPVPDADLLGIVGQSPPIQALRNQIVMYATMPFPVLIEGETGCGKELIASALQKLSGASNAPFKILNCAAISPSLLESALFGHSKGAYTGAGSAQAGFFEDAADGTLFLDEIGELPLDLQANLLRVLENGEYQRVGETSTRKSRARIIAATNRNLRAAIKVGTFRDDLYHRLNVFSITAPPLRELGSDKLLLLNHFRSQYARQIKRPPFELHPEALALWEQYSFPGNTRELRNIVIRLTAKYPGLAISAAQLLDEFDPTVIAKPAVDHAAIRQKIQTGHFELNHELRAQESLYIDVALELSSNNISEAAKLLGINRTTLYSRMDAHEKFKVES
jgi:DNA-binding NtrC family response regulator